MTTLTARQQTVLETIRGHCREHHRPPTVRELGAALGITSPNGVITHLDALERKGAIQRTGDVSRGIRLVGACPLCGREDQ